MPPRRARRLTATAVLALLASACGTGAAPGGRAVAPSTSDDLYANFADCEPLPPTVPHDAVEGIVMPDGMVVADVRRTGVITSVTGFVDSTPLQLRDAFAARTDVEVLHLEDEGFEAEILVDAGDHRSFIKATIRCRTGSIVAVVVAPDDSAGELPTPGGT